MQLNSLERIALSGLMARQREAERQMQDDYEALAREVEKRLKLRKGAVGSTHALDASSLSVVERRELESQKE